ncbi:MAG: rhomboid family intramembrane serine protease [Candidatus Zixiibacteriota bacterium]
MAGFIIGPGSISLVIKILLMVNVAIYLLQELAPFRLESLFGLTPALFFSEFPNLLFQPLTYMFLHGGFGHVFFNMFALWMFGTEIEYGWGSRRFFTFYILAGLAGALLTLVVQSGSAIPIVGASAAIYGVLVAYWLMFPDRYLYIYFLFPVKVKWAIPGFMLLGFLFGGANVAHFAHLGGAFFGLIYLKMDGRWGKLGSWWQGMSYRRNEAKFEKRRLRAEETMKRVDEILDKINEVGIENISDEDRKFLEEASAHLSGEKKSE